MGREGPARGPEHSKSATSHLGQEVLPLIAPEPGDIAASTIEALRGHNLDMTLGGWASRPWW